MSAFFALGTLPGASAIVPVPAYRGRQHATEGGYLSRAPLPTDPLGNFTLTLTGLVVGSRIHVETQAGVSLADIVAAAATEIIALSAYALGSAYNDLRIKVRRGSVTPYYKPWETLSTAMVGAQSIYVTQIPDE